MLSEKDYVEFLVGRDGDFDILAASVIKRCQVSVCSDNSALIWVMPYPTAEYRDNQSAYDSYYDEIEICLASAMGHFKAAHQIRNRTMIDRSDLVVVCIEHTSGGAYRTLKYAECQGKQIINLMSI